MAIMTVDTDNVVDIIKMNVIAIVKDADSITIEENVGNNTIAISVKVAPTDAGKVIGKEARTIKALRIIARAIASKTEKNVNILIID
jgi:predicted RNA-binding protein YlqC (UPF0109 family)